MERRTSKMKPRPQRGDGVVGPPTGWERCVLAFLAADEDEQEEFVAWAQETLEARRKTREFIASWRDAPPPDVRNEPFDDGGVTFETLRKWAMQYRPYVWRGTTQ